MAYGTYLTRNRHSTNWYARIVIPHDLRHAYGRKREIRKTLDTPCKVTARRRALTLWLAYQQVFESLRSGLPVVNISPTWGALAFLTREAKTDAKTSPNDSTESVYTFGEITSLMAVDTQGNRFTVSFVSINPVTGEIVLDNPTQAELEGAERLVKAWAQAKGTAGPSDVEDVPYSARGLVASPGSSPAKSERLSVLFDQFASERLAEAREKSKETMRQHLNVFIELMGDLPATKLTKQVVREFIKLLKTYPTHRNHGRWKAMSLADIRASGKKPISETTQHNIIGNLHTFAAWLVEIDELASNPFRIKLKKKAKAPDPSRTWTDEELRRWFHSDLLLKHRNCPRYAWKFWLPLIAIHCGARLEELAALSPSDFFEHEGVQAFKIHGEDGRFVKNVSSWRVVPVHSHLVSMGLLDYVASRKGQERLFTIEPYKGQYGKRASKAFVYLRDQLNISPDFHGYRHTVIEALKLKGAPLTHIEWLVGHTGTSMSAHYGSATDKRKWLPVLKEVVELLDWSRVMPSE
ncbi:site-specific integrase [Marinobacter sp. TBZ242]|uniref:Site-specific integrase n=1 Tax=Marinobacter azerbaijanicus TaxID=3050455 RepID=A0ABT7IL57_9GAMM|nr:site-specific integrase [Marinobacter sp. TBZ242]MDL0433829.1 site-specific integrase [Marinobacter sp. TBZ242]